MANNFNVRDAVDNQITIRAEEKSSKKSQVVVLDMGGAGVENLLTNNLPVTGLAGEAHVGQVGGTVLWAEATFTRPAENATPYSVNDIVSSGAGATVPITLSNIARVNGGTGYITKARLGTNQSTCTAQFRVWLYTVNNPTLAVDNAPHTLLWTNRASRLGYVDVPALATEGTGSDSAFGMWQIDNGPFAFVTASNDKNLYAVLETKSAFTPASGQAFYLEVFSDVN
jgi:hypothetical protein